MAASQEEAISEQLTREAEPKLPAVPNHEDHGSDSPNEDENTENAHADDDIIANDDSGSANGIDNLLLRLGRYRQLNHNHPWWKVHKHPKTAFSTISIVLSIAIAVVALNPAYRSVVRTNTGNKLTKLGNHIAQNHYDPSVYDWCEAHPVSWIVPDTVTDQANPERRTLSMAHTVSPRLLQSERR